MDQQSRDLYGLFLSYVQVEGHRNILKLICRLLDFIWYKAFLKNKNRPETSLLVSPSHILHAFFFKKCFSSYI